MALKNDGKGEEIKGSFLEMEMVMSQGGEGRARRGSQPMLRF